MAARQRRGRKKRVRGAARPSVGPVHMARKKKKKKKKRGEGGCKSLPREGCAGGRKRVAIQRTRKNKCLILLFFFSPHFVLRSSEDVPLAYKLCKHIIVPSLHRWQLFPREKKDGRKAGERDAKKTRSSDDPEASSTPFRARFSRLIKQRGGGPHAAKKKRKHYRAFHASGTM